MTSIQVKGFQIFADRHGKMRCYHRKTRTSVDLKTAPLGSAEFFAECARITELTKLAGPPKPGTLGLLITEYRASSSFRDLAARTRADYQRCLDYLKPISDTPLVRFDRGLVVRIRDKVAAKHGRRFANYVKAVLSILFSWGAERELREGKPCRESKERSPPEGRTRRKSGLVRRGAGGRPRPPDAGAQKPGDRDHDVHGARPEIRAKSAAQYISTKGEIATRRAKTGEPWFLALPCPADR